MLRLRPVWPNKYILQSLALGAGDCRQAGNKNFSSSIIIIRVIGILSLSLLLELRCACSITQSCPPLCDPLDCTCQAPLSMGFSSQEYWSGLLCPPPGDLPDLGIIPTSPALAGGFFTTSATWEAPLLERLLSKIPPR